MNNINCTVIDSSFILDIFAKNDRSKWFELVSNMKFETTDSCTIFENSKYPYQFLPDQLKDGYQFPYNIGDSVKCKGNIYMIEKWPELDYRNKNLNIFDITEYGNMYSLIRVKNGKIERIDALDTKSDDRYYFEYIGDFQSMVNNFYIKRIFKYAKSRRLLPDLHKI